MITMEKIDYVISVTGESYEKVRRALLDANGDVDTAISMIREHRQMEFNMDEETEDYYSKGFEEGTKRSGSTWDHVENFAEEIIEAVKEIWNKGNASRLVIEDDGKTILSISLTISAIGIILAPLASLLGLSAAIVSKYTFTIILDNGDTIDLKEYIKAKKTKN